MNFTNREKELLLNNAPVLSRITLYDEDGSVLQVFNENDYLIDWDYEDYRYVPNQGFIGQFVERLLDGHLMNVPENISLDNKEIEMEIAVVDPLLENQVYHSYGRFMITKIEKEDTTGSYAFESSDYAKKFNLKFDPNRVSYPCTSLELLNSASEQAGTQVDSDETCGVYIVPEDGLPADNYCFYHDDIYYEFTLEHDLVYKNVIMVYPEHIVLTRVDDNYNVTREEIPYIETDDSEYEVLSARPTIYYNFINNDFVIENNQFNDDDSCRDVVIAITKLGYTWARINTNNKLCLDFERKTERNIDTYDEIDTNKYYEATTTGDTLKPINKILIGMSNVEGENIVKSQDSDIMTIKKIYGETSQNGTPTPSSTIPINNVSGDNEIVVCGKNLFDKTSITLGQRLDPNGLEYPDDNCFTSDYIIIKPNSTYVRNVTPSVYQCVCLYRSDKTFISRSSTTQTIITTNDTKYVRLTAYNENLDVLQFELGNQATPYEAYNGATYNIDLPVENKYKNPSTIPITSDSSYSASTNRIDDNSFSITCIKQNSNNKSWFSEITLDISKFKPNTTYTLSKKSTSTGTQFTNQGALRTKINGNYGVTINADSITFTTPSTLTGLAVLFYGAYNTTMTGEAIITFTDIQLEEGSKVNSFAPYGTIPIELNKIGTYQDKIFKTSGKNLNKYPYSATGNGNGITFTASNDGIITLNGQNNGNGNSVYMFFNNSTNPMILEAGTYYIIPPSNTNIVYVMYDGTKYYNFRSNNGYSCTFDERVSILLFYIQVYSGNTTTFTNEVAYPMLSKLPNQTIEDYEPYGSNNEWYLKKTIGEVVLDGSESGWGKSGNTNNVSYYYSGLASNSSYKFKDINTSIMGTTSSTNIYPAYSNYFKFIQGNQIFTDIVGSIFDYISNTKTIELRLGFGVNSEINTVDKLKTWLSTHNTIVEYPLATPEYQTITYQPLIDQLNALQNAGLFEGTNHITIDTLNEVPTVDITVTNLEQDSTSYSGKSFEITGHDYSNGSQINIYDNPLTYTEELRRIAIGDAECLFGMTYTPMNIQSIGHPWLTGNELMKVTNLENDNLLFYPFDRKITYKGYIETELSSQAKNDTQQKYENPNNIINRMNKTEIIVDKANKQIESIVQSVEETNDKMSRVTQDMDGVTTQIENVNKTVDNNTKDIATIQETIEGLSVETSVTGGTNLIKNSVGYFDNDFWMINDNTEGNIKTLNNIDVKNNSISACALLLQNETVYQKITEIKNGSYYISFRYKRLISNANCKLVINGEEFNLTSDNWKDEGKEIPVTANNIQVSLISNKNDSCLITDLIVSNGTSKISWTQNANETYTDGVKIGKGITITATGSDTELSATASSIDIVNTRNRESTSTFDKYGIKTNSLESKGTIRVADKLIISRVGDQMWISTL